MLWFERNSKRFSMWRQHVVLIAFILFGCVCAGKPERNTRILFGTISFCANTMVTWRTDDRTNESIREPCHLIWFHAWQAHLEMFSTEIFRWNISKLMCHFSRFSFVAIATVGCLKHSKLSIYCVHVIYSLVNFWQKQIFQI